MNIYTQIVSITLGGLLSISEILPFIRNVKTNGILHFIIDSFIDNENQDLENLIEHESLLNHSGMVVMVVTGVMVVIVAMVLTVVVRQVAVVVVVRIIKVWKTMIIRIIMIMRIMRMMII